MVKKRGVIKNKSMIGICIVLLMISSIFGVVGVLGISQKSYLGNGFNIRTSRNFVDWYGSGASGKADITSIATGNGFNKVNIQINGKNLIPEKGYFYEAWLISYGGNEINLGKISPSKNGRFYLSYKKTMKNFLIYDAIIIVQKPMNTEYPDGMLVLVADITGLLNID